MHCAGVERQYIGTVGRMLARRMIERARPMQACRARPGHGLHRLRRRQAAARLSCVRLRTALPGEGSVASPSPVAISLHPGMKDESTLPAGTVRLHRVIRSSPHEVCPAFLEAETMARWLFVAVSPARSTPWTPGLPAQSGGRSRTSRAGTATGLEAGIRNPRLTRHGETPTTPAGSTIRDPGHAPGRFSVFVARAVPRNDWSILS